MPFPQFSRLNPPICVVALLIAIAVLPSGNAIAQSPSLDETTLLLLTDPLDPNLLEPGATPADGSIVTAETVEQNPPAGLTLPSLWWTQEQFGGKLLATWIANAGLDGTPPRVDLIVNQQIWSSYSYLERYTFLNQFGTAAQDFGYSTRIFNRQQELLAAYICPDAADGSCSVFLDSSGPGGFQGGFTISPFPTSGGTGQP
ncbi:hypothetical protein H6F67_25055 [Microcoleus sp. FACHB-1515]|uniref:hypothetical protein n=1 Tax=Cyanophyceae TaxID=3028117 RepID=UPI0016828721|nr:hypothetical protein [Microcoleus sp. FACHB-1515]MBD2093117.1 hypothetical protein [Microcoleus sp. FACHB-1515]